MNHFIIFFLLKLCILKTLAKKRKKNKNLEKFHEYEISGIGLGRFFGVIHFCEFFLNSRNFVKDYI